MRAQDSRQTANFGTLNVIREGPKGPSLPAPANVTTAALEVRGLWKSFGGTTALKGVDLVVQPGTIHGLLGENGSGKSTLIKLLAGYHAPDRDAELRILGKAHVLPLSALAYRSLNMAFVHQDLALVPSLSVLENLRIMSMTAPRLFHVNWRQERRETQRLIAEYGIPARGDQPVADLPRHVQTMIAIARAIDHLVKVALENEAELGVLVLDEPTAALTGDERRQLHELMRHFRNNGGGVILVSHDLNEAIELADELTVLRDGSVAARYRNGEYDVDDVVHAIVGQKSVSEATPRRARDADVALTVAGLASDQLRDISFSVQKGEILGITGLAGSGFTSVCALLTGAKRPLAGTLTLHDSSLPLTKLSPRRALGRGIVYLPEERRDGCVADLSITDNITLSRIAARRGLFPLQRRAVGAEAQSLMAKYQVNTHDGTLPVSALSGGNQQKVLLARCLSTSPSVILLDEPTSGVDVGARSEIFRILQEAAKAGTTIICASSDWEQLELICDRVLVIRHGIVSAELVAPISRPGIAQACFAADQATETIETRSSSR